MKWSQYSHFFFFAKKKLAKLVWEGNSYTCIEDQKRIYFKIGITRVCLIAHGLHAIRKEKFMVQRREGVLTDISNYLWDSSTWKSYWY